METKVSCILCLTVLTVLFVFCGCEKKSQTEEKELTPIIVGFSQIGSESAWRTCNTQSMKEAAAVEDIQLVYANAEQKQENQIKAIRSFIVYQVDVIVFVPIGQDGWDNVLREAKEAGIPVIVIDRSIRTSDESLYVGYLGSDHKEEGRKAARFLQQKFSRIQRPLNILEIRGTDGSSAADGRYEGFRDVIDKDSRFKIIYSESGDFLRSRGKEIVERILSVNGKLQIDGQPIDIIFSHNDSMTLGFLDVLDEHGIRCGKDVTIVSVDAEQEAINALKEKKINCVVECNPKLGPQTMNLVKTVYNKYEIPRVTSVDETVFTEYDNLSAITPRGY